MTRRGVAPGPLFTVAVGALIIAFAADHPLIIAAVTVGALVIHFAARSGPIPLLVGATVALGTALLNPFVQANGDLIVVAFPDIPILDMQVTFEELVAGAVIGARALTVVLLVSAALVVVDPDRLLAAASRVAPRSALTAALAARALPTLRRDARALGEAAALRGRPITHGTRRQRVATAGRLSLPLVGSALERSLDVAEAMAARGYGGGPATRVTEAPHTRREWTLLSLGLPLVALGVTVIATRHGSFRFYPTTGPLWNVGAALTAAAILTALAAVAHLVRR